MTILSERPPVVVKGARLVTFQKPDSERLAYLREHSGTWYAKNREWHNRRRREVYGKQRSKAGDNFE